MDITLGVAAVPVRPQVLLDERPERSPSPIRDGSRRRMFRTGDEA